ncbi:MAG: signal peptidase II [Wenzhouxiangellaceae bacterium]
MTERILFMLRWLLLSGAIIVADLWTKALASRNLELYSPQPLTDWFNLTLAHNRGAAFSFLHGADGWQRWLLSGISLVVSVILVVWLWQTPLRSRRQALAISLVLGGAIGNLVDRLRLGYVVDFIDVHVAGWHWPAFNIADSAITIGITLLIIDSFWPAQRSPAAERSVSGQAADN